MIIILFASYPGLWFIMACDSSGFTNLEGEHFSSFKLIMIPSISLLKRIVLFMSNFELFPGP